MKKATRAAFRIAAVYTATSLILSGLTSLGIGRNTIIRHRVPFTIIDVNFSTVDGIEPDGHIYGHNHLGEYIGFGIDQEVYPVDLQVVSVMLWNPLNNYCDDIVERYDILSFR